MKNIKYSGKYLTLFEEEIEVNGKKHIYEKVEVRSGVTIFPIRDNKILIIKEKRIDEGRDSWRFISGWVDKENKTIEEHAKEELLEEVAMKADEWELFYTSDIKGSIASRIDFFIAKNPVKVEFNVINPDGDVVLEEKWIDEEEFFEMLDKKELDWRKSSIVALMYFRSVKS